MEKDLLNIQNIRNLILNNEVDWTLHCLNRLNQRSIKRKDVKDAINNGKIIEYYYEDYPHPSCLILGYNQNQDAIHTVCGISDNLVHMITAYYPDEEKWENNLENRRQKR